jgi:hypothetical protein
MVPTGRKAVEGTETGNIGYGGKPHLNMDYFHDFLIFCKKKWGIIFWATLVSSVVVLTSFEPRAVF